MRVGKDNNQVVRGRVRNGIMLGRVAADSGFQRKHARTHFAPINWASFRPLLAAMVEARDSALVIGEATAATAPHEAPHAGSVLALRASAEYILELTRCLETRPQGKGGWQRVAKLDALLAQVEAALDAA